MKRLLLSATMVLCASLTAHAGSKWTGPTSPIDPMWGMKGSSIMAEALRDPDSKLDPAFDLSSDSKSKRIRELESEIESLRKNKSARSSIFSIDDDD